MENENVFIHLNIERYQSPLDECLLLINSTVGIFFSVVAVACQSADIPPSGYTAQSSIMQQF